MYYKPMGDPHISALNRGWGGLIIRWLVYEYTISAIQELQAEGGLIIHHRLNT